ncbi:MAG: hypothetical protein H7A04_10370 [Pseudomonadales bacterium]|nr:hypothetical protein [Pseudomonadales bacterium]
MSFYLVIAAAGLVSIGSNNFLNKAEAYAIGIFAEAREMEVSYENPPPPVSFTVGLGSIKGCQVTNVWMDIFDNEGFPVLGASIESVSGAYRFYVPQMYLSYSSLIISCDQGESNHNRLIGLSLGKIWNDSLP